MNSFVRSAEHHRYIMMVIVVSGPTWISDAIPLTWRLKHEMYICYYFISYLSTHSSA